MDETSPLLSEEEKQALLRLARKTIEEYMRERRVSPLPPVSGPLQSPCGCFVTIHRQGRLRGCIGRFVGTEEREPPSLARVVQAMAVEAAVGDPRFPPVGEEELGEIDIELSVLSPPRVVNSPLQVVVGRHGLIVSRGVQRGVLLPQVPVEQRWDRETFLSQTCVKGGFDPDAWRRGEVTLEVFTAQVFGEKGVGSLFFTS